jgi:hypothetical protein
VHATLLAELGGIILALGLLGRLAGRYGQSPIPLYLLAGLAFGHGGLLPLSASEEFVATGADIGVVLLLLTLGLEYTAAELVTSLKGISGRGRSRAGLAKHGPGSLGTAVACERRLLRERGTRPSLGGPMFAGDGTRVGGMYAGAAREPWRPGEDRS